MEQTHTAFVACARRRKGQYSVPALQTCHQPIHRRTPGKLLRLSSHKGIIQPAQLHQLMTMEYGVQSEHFQVTFTIKSSF